MSPRTQRCDEGTIAGRLRKAEQFFDAAETIRERRPRSKGDTVRAAAGRSLGTS